MYKPKDSESNGPETPQAPDKPEGATVASPDSPKEERRAPYKPKYKPLWNNVITMIGLFIVISAGLGLVTFGLFSIVAPANNPYVDIVGYLVIPSILIMGLVICPLGILFKSWRLRRRNPEEHLAFRLPKFDLNDPIQRRAAKFVVGMTFILLPVVGVSSYHGYHYTDSVNFCSKVCHVVMEPQGVAFERSAHARVACAECHIGEGAGWFVKSKLSGTRQVVATWQDSFPRPIPPAISHLRPARETCEHCHWPQKFFGAQLHEMARFASDEQNTRRDISMLLKTGGADAAGGRAEGIHKHMALGGQIEYIAVDDKLQDIPWVRFAKDDGTELIYRSDNRPSSDPPPDGQLRVLDCMDCHNRPAHRFHSPDKAVDSYLEIGPKKMDPALPYIKREAVAALVAHYPDRETAEREIGQRLTDFYKQQYPEVWADPNGNSAVYRAIDSVREIYRGNFFPSMNVDWQTYPDNIGHKYSAGCFRCHEGRHVNQYGEPISHDCHVCHTFLNPVASKGKEAVIEEGEFIHPMEWVGRHAELRCSECHDGGPAKPPTCQGCHAATTALRTAETHAVLASAPEFDADPMADLDCSDCHDLSEPRSLEALDEACTGCHDPDEDERFDGMLTQWDQSLRRAKEGAAAALAEVTQAIEEAPSDGDQTARKRWLDENTRLLEFLDRAGPMHNYKASLMLYQQITQQAQQYVHSGRLADTGS